MIILYLYTKSNFTLYTLYIAGATISEQQVLPVKSSKNDAGVEIRVQLIFRTATYYVLRWVPAVTGGRNRHYEITRYENFNIGKYEHTTHTYLED